MKESDKEQTGAVTAEVKIPVHVAIIPDGNRRWARKNNLPIIAGHKKGADVFKKTVEHCADRGVKYVTFYAFSSENNKRSQNEVSDLMSLFSYFLKNADTELGRGRNKVRVRVIGRREGLSRELCEEIDRLEAKTKDNKSLTLFICINYGGRDELTDCVKKIGELVKNGCIDPDDIDENTVKGNLYSGNIPDPDIMIRTSGEKRISNFLLWSLAYTEFFFPEKLWPEFTNDDIDEIFVEYNKRNRRYGV